jgi:hypothetical protein
MPLGFNSRPDPIFYEPNFLIPGLTPSWQIKSAEKRAWPARYYCHNKAEFIGGETI